MATPRRAFAQMKDLLVRKGWLDPAAINKASYQMVPLPFASIMRMAPILAQDRFSPFTITKGLVDSEIKKIAKSRFPIPIDIPYQVDFWVRRKFTEARILEWLFSKLARQGVGLDEFTLTVNLGSFFGNKLVTVAVGSFADNSSLEPDELDVDIRFTVDLTIKAWMTPLPGEEEYLVHTLLVDMVDKNTDEVYDSYNLYNFNIIELPTWKLENNSATASLEILDNGHLEFVSGGGSPPDYMYSPDFPAYDENYELEGKYNSDGEVVILVKDGDTGSIVVSQSLPQTTEQIFMLSFSNASHNTLFIEVRVEGQVDFSSFYVRRKSYTV